MERPRHFVQLSEDRTQLALDGKPWRMVGANCYYLMTRAADPDLVHEVTAVLDAAAAAGINVLRCWAFADGDSQWNALQVRPGELDERVFNALDWVVAQAGRRGLRLLLVLTNYWDEYGGMPQYVAWSRGAAGLPAADAAADAFYDDQRCQVWYSSYVSQLLSRVNTITGVAYSDDPVIVGWAPANEPQCHTDSGHEQGAVAHWAHAAAGLIKRLAPRQLVFMDCEGFVGPSTPDSCSANPYDCARTGCDFVQDCGSPFIDVACCHVYPDLWLPHADEAAKLQFALQWINCHVALCRRLGKPLCVTEWGKRAGPAPLSRAAYFQGVLGRVLEHMQQEAPLAGSAFWMMAAPSYPDQDGFTVYFEGTQVQDQTAAVIRRHAAQVRALDGEPHGEDASVSVHTSSQESSVEAGGQHPQAGRVEGEEVPPVVHLCCCWPWMQHKLIQWHNPPVG